MATPSIVEPSARLADAETLLARRRAAQRQQAIVADDRWLRYLAAAARRGGPGDRSRLERRLDGGLARARWPGRVLQIARSGLWSSGMKTSLAYGGGSTAGLVRYVRAGGDPQVRPKALFDQAWYLRQYPELRGGSWAPISHYLVHGDANGRSPHPLFDTRDYRARHAVKIAASRMTALQHYLFQGAREGFDPHPLFDLRYYVGRCEALAESGEDPLIHYLRQGWRDGLDPHPLFAGDWYLANNPQAAACGSAPLLHYLAVGAAEGLDPHPLFSTRWYLANQRDAALSRVDPLSHFVRRGARQRSSPGPHFDAAYYLEQHAELSERGVNPLIHYLTEGAFAGAWPAADFDEAAYLAANPQAADTPWSGLEHWLRTKTSRPPLSQHSPTRWASAESLFEQLRANARIRDPAAFNLPAYEALSAQLRQDAGAVGPRVAVAPDGDRHGMAVIATDDPAAANAQAQACDEEVLLFMGKASQGRLAPLAAAAARPGVGLVTPLIVDGAGAVLAAGVRIEPDGGLTPNRIFPDPAAAGRQVDAPGAAAAVRRAAYLAAGGLDPRFETLAGALSDLALRLRAEGMASLIEPEAALIMDRASSISPRDAQALMERWGEAIEALGAVRVIAFHRPDLAGAAAWGTVVQALPGYRGHYQPHLPGRLGFYDSDDPRAFRRQADLASCYGLAGFCHVLTPRAPPRFLIEAAAPDLPFCLCLTEDERTPQAAASTVALLAAFLRDPRALRVDGAALILATPDPARSSAWADGLRAAARAEGLGELFLVRYAGFGLDPGPDPRSQGFDAAVDFAAAGAVPPIPAPGPVLDLRAQSVIRDYRVLARRLLAEPGPASLPGLLSGYDDSAAGGGQIHHHASPGAFQAWLEAAMAQVRERRFGDEKLVFVHAWNGWTEGAHLEPDIHFGDGWLEAVRNAADADLLRRS